MLDALVVIAPVGLVLGVPRDLLLPDGLAVDDRGGLAVGGAEIKADAVAVEVAAEGLGSVLLGGAVFERNALDLESLLVDAAHEVVVERTRAVGRVDLLEVIGDLRLAGDGHLVAAALPEEELDEALGIHQVRAGVGRVGRPCAGRVD